MEKPVELRYCLYARKSSEQDERQAMSIDSQIKEMLDLAERDGLNIVKILKESHSAKDTGQRPVFNQLIKEIDGGEFNAVLVWDPSRLSRCAGDLGSLVDLMDRNKLVKIQTFSQTFTNNPNEKFLLMILCSQAKLENDNRGINVKRGIRAKCELGWRPGVAPAGYMNRAFNGVKDIIPDPDRADTIVQIFEKAAQGWSGRKIKDWLDETGFTNKSGKKVTLSHVLKILNSRFYHGEFEYPEGSGKVYQGLHEPLIPKELYEQVQQSRVLPNKAQWGSKTFAFKGIFKCASCGSDITAEEKFKALKDGTFKRHVYYHCTRQVKYDCPEKYLNEDELTQQLIDYIASHKDDIQVTDKLAARAVRHAEVVEATLSKRGFEYEEIEPLPEYTQFVLVHGSYGEKQGLVEGIKTTFTISNKAICVS